MNEKMRQKVVQKINQKVIQLEEVATCHQTQQFVDVEAT